jgi:hypothetical protein
VGAFEGGVVAAERRKFIDRCPALYVIDVLESRDHDGPRAFARVCTGYLLLEGGWGQSLQSCAVNGIMGHEIHSHSDAARVALRISQMRNTDREQ